MQDNVEVRKALEAPFPVELVKTRPGAFGDQLNYIEAVHYIRRLNQAYEGGWSFEIVSHQVEEKEVFVVGKLLAAGVIKMAFGSSEITRRKDDSEIVCLGDDLKAASTDALKKAASLLGLGLSLYDEQPQNGGKHSGGTPGNGNRNGQSKAPGNGNGNGNANGDSRLTSRQHSYIKSLAGEKGLTEDQLEKMSLERYAKKLAFVTKNEASSLIGELQGS